MDVIIPVAGKGTRTRPHSLYTSKPLLFVAGKKIIEHIIEVLGEFEEKIERLIFVIGKDQEDFIKYMNSKRFAFKVEYRIQESPLGLGDAVYQGLKDVENDVLIMLGDTIVKFTPALLGKDSFIGVMEVEDPRRFGVVKVEKGIIVDMEEKPDEPPTNLAIAGVYYIKDSYVLKGALERIIESNVRTKGEIQLTDALKWMCRDQYRFRSLLLSEWYDCGTCEALLATNRKLLLKNFTVTHHFYDSLIINPVWIHPEAVIEESVIGPFVSVDKGAKIKNSIIRSSIINSNSLVENVVLRDSIIGERAICVSDIKSFNIGPFSCLKNS